MNLKSKFLMKKFETLEHLMNIELYISEEYNNSLEC